MKPNEEKLKEMANPNKVGRAREFLQQGRKNEVYGDNEYYRKGFLDGGLYADEHPKNPWRWLCDEKPPVKQLVLFMDAKGVPHLGRGNIDGESATISAEDPCEITLKLWMPIPELPNQ